MTVTNDHCVFCRSVSEALFTGLASDRFEVRWDGYPLTKGHALVIPKRHIVSFFNLTPDEIIEAFMLLHAARQHVDRIHEPDGYNVGINDGTPAGRTIDHLHIHLIPRYIGDTPNPRGGIRNMLPGPSPDLWSPTKEGERTSS